MELDYLLIDVFTDRPFGGSRLTHFPGPVDLPARLMQDLAQEMGCGETSFVVSRDGSDRGRLRVFTPSVEIPAAGHAVLGATFACHHLDDAGAAERRGEAQERFVWELEGGASCVETLAAVTGRLYNLVLERPVFLGQYYNRARVARALDLPESEIAITGLPCEVISTGLPTHVVPLASLEAVEAAKLRRGEADAIARELGFGDLFVFTTETRDPEAAVHCRMFAPYFGIPEDPASGAATGALAAYIVKHRLLKFRDSVRFVSEQGLEIGRPSRLLVDADVEAGVAVRVRVGGHCVLVGRGTIHLP
ncbi:MAG: PhzF family phenazine biosynthesis protein [Candidatus Krumholzibacteriia bacterium]